MESADADPACELCDAAVFTERFHDDDLCWVAECDSCSVPMVVWRVHHPNPPDDVRSELHDRLRRIVASFFVDEVWIDEKMRTIPSHYHAHARRRHGFPTQPLRRRSVQPVTGGHHTEETKETP